MYRAAFFVYVWLILGRSVSGFLRNNSWRSAVIYRSVFASSLRAERATLLGVSPLVA